MEKIHVFKTGMNFDVDIFIGSTKGTVQMEELVGARQTIEKDAEALQRTAIAVDGYRLATYSRNARRKWLYASTG